SKGLEQCGTAHKQIPAVNVRPDAFARHCLKVVCHGNPQLSLLRTPDDALRDGVFRIAFHCSRESQRFIGSDSLDRSDVYNAEFSSNKSTGLVKHDGVDKPSVFETASIADE